MSTSEATRKKIWGGIILQVVIVFALCGLMTGVLTYMTEFYHASNDVTVLTESRAEKTASEVKMAIHEYPAYQWMLRYWYEHSDELDIYYDEDNIHGTGTERKLQVFMKRNPEFHLRYATEESLETLSAEDQKLYAEITYSWLLTRLNQIKRILIADYLFIVSSEAPYEEQFFVMSAADPGAVRGTDYEQVYPLGVIAEIGESQQKGMAYAVKKRAYMATAGDYVDYYSYIETIDGRDLFVGFTFDQRDIFTDIKSETLQGSLLAVLYQIFLSLIFAASIFFLVIRPLKKVQRNINLYKETKDSGMIMKNLSEIHLNNEIGELAIDVSDLAEEIDEYLEKISRISAERERIGTELALAERIQASSLPHDFPPFPERNEFDLYASMSPAREVGGDFYDFFMIDDDHLGLVIADVSGKGIPGALFMMTSKVIIKNNAMLGMSPADILSRSNDMICAGNSADMFVTVWVGILEISTGRLTAANAGHEYPAIKRPGQNFEIVKDKHGFLVGGFEGMKYENYELNLEPGTKLFVYTDGVPEATNAGKELFGMDRMLEALNRKPDAEPEEVLKNMTEQVAAFVKDEEQFDDITMLCIDYNGCSAK